MLLFGPYLVATGLWLFATTMMTILVTRVYINAALAARFGRVRSKPATALRSRGGSAPFVTVMLATYNEAQVIDRLLSSVTAIEYPNYEVIVADDSTDSSALMRLKKWERRGSIRLIHRSARHGFKAGALNNAMKHIDPRSRYIAFFDADYVPQKDVLWQLISDFSSSDVAVVQGYTQHTLNASENAFTKSTRIAFSYYCMVDVSVRKRLNSFIPIFGSVFMITRKSLAEVGGFNESSITEDYDLASKLAERGYRVVFDESINVPGECPSTLAGLVKQQIRWAEGVTRDTKNNFMKILHSKCNAIKKFDYLFYGFGSLNGLIGTMSYGLSIFVFLVNERLIPSLGVDRGLILGLGAFGKFMLFVAPIYMPFAFVIAVLVALYRENKLSDFRWCIYFIAINFLLAPFIAYGAMRGLLLEKGTWYRTPKTGRVF